MADAASGEFAEYVAHEDFRSGLPAGRFRVIVDPKLARRYVSQRLLLVVVVLPVIGVGIALALTGRTWPGALLIAAGVLLNRVVMWQAGRILLHLALRDAKTYEQVTQGGVMEVRRV
ncbi:hypothetical protein WG902_08080 [Ramlibacter sp. PS3R-8]|uniref:hypothetical protein n=1 Tax=Ramlibacter sp. PS3R-8 TaxID=3133437 RepID=UPI0030A1A626